MQTPHLSAALQHYGSGPV